MRAFFYVVCTIFIGFFCQIFLNRYLSVTNVSPHVLLLLVLAHGFILGPLMGEVVGFIWGLLCDSMGLSMFGMQSLLLTIAGYVSGSLRRRVASDRATAQVVIALLATLFYAVGSHLIAGAWEDSRYRISVISFIVQSIFNILLVTVVFLGTENWINLWKLHHERL